MCGRFTSKQQFPNLVVLKPGAVNATEAQNTTKSAIIQPSDVLRTKKAAFAACK